MIKSPDNNGRSQFYCKQGAHFVLEHNGEKVLSKGPCGQISTEHTLEYFDTEFDMEDRIVFLGLVDDE